MQPLDLFVLQDVPKVGQRSPVSWSSPGQHFQFTKFNDRNSLYLKSSKTNSAALPEMSFLEISYNPIFFLYDI